MNASATHRDKQRIVIIGGGISGLAAAHKIIESEISTETPEILVLEASSRAGGVISTVHTHEHIFELGPDSLITQKPWALNLIKRLGLSSHIIETNKENRRTYVAWQNKLHQLPDGFVMLAPTNLRSFFQSSLFSLSGKLRMALETCIPKSSPNTDESLAKFVRRRFGQEALERVAQPMIGGIYTADPEKLSLQATMPRFLDLEQQHGSVIRGLMAQGKNNAAGARYSLFISLDKGLSLLVDALVNKLPKGTLKLETAVKSVGKSASGFTILTSDNQKIEANYVIIATSAFQAAKILGDLDSRLSAKLAEIDYAPSAVLNLVYKKRDLKKPFKGFGFVVPQKEKRSIIAVTFTSHKFAGRATEDTLLLRVFMGGALNKNIFALPDDDLIRLAKQDLKTYLDLDAEPQSTRLTRYPQSMPQYHLGHASLISDMRTLSDAYPELAIAGNYINGPGIPDCVLSGEKAAESILENLATKEKLQSIG